MSGFFSSLASRMDIVRELLAFFWKSKLWWLTPMIIILVLFAGLMIFAQSSACPFHLYTFLMTSLFTLDVDAN